MAVTGANGRQILLDREERKALLRHLLKDEAQETIETNRGTASSSSSAKGTWFGPIFLGDSGFVYLRGGERTFDKFLTSITLTDELALGIFAALAAQKEADHG